MKETESANMYSININKKKYVFSCPDGEEYVKALEKKLTDTINAVTGEDTGYVLSDYAMKIALLLADEAMGEKKLRRDQLTEIEQKVTPMLEELDKVLGMEGQI